jgi:hypothetical protein
MGKVKRSSQLVESVAHEAMTHLRQYVRAAERGKDDAPRSLQ